MELTEYQKRAGGTAIYGESVDIAIHNLDFHVWQKVLRLHYVALKLAGEAGEVAQILGKSLRDNYGELSDEAKQALRKEVGDVLWYVSQLATELGLDLDLVAYENLRKLGSRAERGVLGGSGDDR